jgi:hypothetical protein
VWVIVNGRSIAANSAASLEPQINLPILKPCPYHCRIYCVCFLSIFAALIQTYFCLGPFLCWGRFYVEGCCVNIILGIIVVLGCVIGGFALHGGNPMALMSPVEILIICGASFGAMIIGNPLSVTIGVVKSAGALMTPSKFNKTFYLEILTLLYDILNKTRREGLMAIEGDIEEPETSPLFSNYPEILKDHHIVEFICDYLRLDPSAGGSESYKVAC